MNPMKLFLFLHMQMLIKLYKSYPVNADISGGLENPATHFVSLEREDSNGENLI